MMAAASSAFSDGLKRRKINPQGEYIATGVPPCPPAPRIHPSSSVLPERGVRSVLAVELERECHLKQLRRLQDALNEEKRLSSQREKDVQYLVEKVTTLSEKGKLLEVQFAEEKKARELQRRDMEREKTAIQERLQGELIAMKDRYRRNTGIAKTLQSEKATLLSEKEALRMRLKECERLLEAATEAEGRRSEELAEAEAEIRQLKYGSQKEAEHSDYQEVHQELKQLRELLAEQKETIRTLEGERDRMKERADQLQGYEAMYKQVMDWKRKWCELMDGGENMSLDHVMYILSDQRKKIEILESLRRNKDEEELDTKASAET